MGTVLFPKTIEVVQSLGIDPATILVDGIDINGYDEIVTDENRNRQYDKVTGEILFTRKPWPSQEAALKVLSVVFLEREKAGML